jgi:tRNA (guanine26-N2/guanine27-N2)-dimethyltransferase
MTDATAQTIDATPQVGQHISHDGKEYTTIKEGLAHILVPHGVPTSTDPKLSKEETQKQQVFYNPIQQFNRDLSVLAIKTFGQDSIQRKLQKHEQFKKKNERKRQRLQEKRVTEEPTADADGTSGTFGAREAPSKKRKLAEGESEEGAVPAKKQKVTENGEEQEVDDEAVQNDSTGTNGERPAWRPQFTILDALSATGCDTLKRSHLRPQLRRTTCHKVPWTPSSSM